MKPALRYAAKGPLQLCDKTHKVLSPLPAYPVGQFWPGSEIITTGELASDCREIITGKNRISPQFVFVAVFRWVYFTQSGRKSRKPSEIRWVCLADLLNLTRVMTPLELWKRKRDKTLLEAGCLHPPPASTRNFKRCRLRR